MSCVDDTRRSAGVSDEPTQVIGVAGEDRVWTVVADQGLGDVRVGDEWAAGLRP